MRSVRLTMTTQRLPTRNNGYPLKPMAAPTRNNGCPNPNGDRFAQTATTVILSFAEALGQEKLGEKQGKRTRKITRGEGSRG